MTIKEQFTIFFLCSALIINSLLLQFAFYPVLWDTISDFRSTKEFLAICFTIGIVFWSLYARHDFRCRNTGLLFLIGYICAHPFFSPGYSLELFHQNVAGFWEYKPIFYSLIYFCLFCIISNLRIEKKHFEQIFKTIMWIGFLTSIYALLQYFHLDEFQKLASWGNAPNTPQGNMSATFTHPNYAGCFIMLSLPFTFYFRRYFKAAIMLVTIFVMNGKMAIFGSGVIAGYFLFKFNRIVFSLYTLGGIVGLFLMRHFFAADWTDSGRFGLWKTLWHDITQPWIAEKAFPLLGHGLGSYSTIWCSVHPGMMTEAHNEFLQFLFEAGIVGVSLLIFSIFWLLREIKLSTITDSQTTTLMASFLGIVACSLGLFVWQIEPHRFISVVIFALLHNKLIIKEERQ